MLMKVGYFTSGNSGAGALVRAFSIEQALARTGRDVEFKAFASSSPAAFEGTYVNHGGDKDRPGVLAELLEEWTPDLLLVNLCWALVPRLKCRRWLLLRSVPWWWLHGEGWPWFERHLKIEPLMLGHRGGVELEEIDPVVYEVGVGDVGIVRGTSAVACTGGSAQTDLLVRMARRESLVEPAVYALHQAAAWQPVTSKLASAERVYTGGGYNSVWESVHFKYNSRARQVAFPSGWDDQASRILTARTHVPRGNGADQLAAMILAG
jgi:hypothetical protein